MRETWNLIVDEALEVTYYRKFFAENFPDVILRLFNVLPCGNDHPKYRPFGACQRWRTRTDA